MTKITFLPQVTRRKRLKEKCNCTLNECRLTTHKVILVNLLRGKKQSVFFLKKKRKKKCLNQKLKHLLGNKNKKSQVTPGHTVFFDSMSSSFFFAL